MTFKGVDVGQPSLKKLAVRWKTFYTNISFRVINLVNPFRDIDFYYLTPVVWPLPLTACLHGSGGTQVGEVTRLGGVTRLSI